MAGYIKKEIKVNPAIIPAISTAHFFETMALPDNKDDDVAPPPPMPLPPYSLLLLLLILPFELK